MQAEGDRIEGATVSGKRRRKAVEFVGDIKKKNPAKIQSQGSLIKLSII